jgi:hypothetical protein
MLTSQGGLLKSDLVYYNKCQTKTLKAVKIRDFKISQVKIAQIITEKLLYELNASECIFNYMRLGELSETFSTQSNHSQ